MTLSDVVRHLGNNPTEHGGAGKDLTVGRLLLRNRCSIMESSVHWLENSITSKERYLVGLRS